MKRGYFVQIAAAATALMTVLVTVLFSAKKSHAGDTTGITKTAPVSPKVVEQTLDLDIGALAGGQPETWELQVDKVLVDIGQPVWEGTPLFRVTPDSVQKIRTALQKEIMDADKECALLEAGQRALYLQASQEYDRDITDGKYADITYKNKCDALQEKADVAKQAVDDRQNQINENLLELARIQQELAQAQGYLWDARTAVYENYNDRYDNAYYYAVYENTREAAEKMTRQLEEQVKSLTRKNELLLYEVDEALRTYHQLIQDLEKEKLAVKMDYDTKIYHAETASEWYDIQTGNPDSALQDARERYQSALRNIRAFDAYVARNQILSGYSGILADIVAEAGDSVSANDRLVTFYDQQAVTMAIPLDGKEYRAVNAEEAVKVTFADCPDEIYEGRITKVSDTVSGYTVTVTVQCGAADIYEGMTGSVTFCPHFSR